MLEELMVRNFALIDSLSLSFEGGFNILTGETGAGKSIIVGSLSFLLGAKAGAEVIRTGAEEASVSAVVSLGRRSADTEAWLAVRGIPVEDRRIIVRRTIRRTGRGGIYLQNTPVTRSDLEEFMAFLFDLHGQHAHESLMRKENYRRYLDRFAGLESEAAEFNRMFLILADRKKAFEASVRSEQDREIRLEVLSYAVEEIAKANIKSGESRELEAEAARLGSFERLAAQVNGTAAALFDEDVSVLSLARRARSALENAAAIDESGLAAMRQRMEALYYEAEDLAEEFRAYRDGLTSDPDRLEEVEERLAVLYRLKKKYAQGSIGVVQDEDAVLAYKAEAEAEIEALSGAKENRDKLKAEIGTLEKETVSRASVLTAKRAAAAARLGKGITAIIANLGMPNAKFSAALHAKGKNPGTGALVIGPWGADDVEFLISTNAGEPLKELSKIASGGELSRVMLAIKTILAGADSPRELGPGNEVSDASPETLIFDEIDTGIGGEIALAVGDYLARIGTVKQIFCVTHLASIAVRADNHLKVEKYSSGGRTATAVSVLRGDARREEIARMLAGDSGGKAALAHADALLAKYTRGLYG
ncbi:MAG: DNA repair protein RecN [Spirochaetaceae bacterium]|jgi:DNA repair protein RecN (Recombination protein N)|nr:DNA repair protein RecN [Spirochaetaceae bacterium]